MVAINQFDNLAAATADKAETVPVDSTKLATADAIVLKSGDSLGSPVAVEAVALANEPVIEYTTALQDVTYNNIAGTIVRIYGLDTTKVVTVDGVTAKYYQQRNASGELTGKTVHIACIAKTAEPKITVADGTPVEIKFGNANGDSAINGNDLVYLSNSILNKSITGRTGTIDYSLPTDLMELVILDVNADGKVNGNDLVYLSNSILNKSITGRTGTVEYTLNTMACLTK